VLLAGWQFDTDACLLRGEEAEHAPLPVTLLAYLDALCQRNPALRIYVLAWDFHAVFALEREWMQQWRFQWLTSERLQFLFDSHHVDGGAHHQKFVVIDGQLSFLGGLDLCDHRWDDRSHHDPNPLRVSRGAPHRPFHDVQAYVASTELGARLTELFGARWRAAGGEPLELTQPPPGPLSSYQPARATPLASRRVALSRVDPFGAPDGAANCREITDLTLDAIQAARRLVYVETQYFSSQEIGRALAARLRDTSREPLDVVLVLNEHAETVKEEIAVGLAQAKVIKELREAAAGSSNRLGIYFTVPHTEPGVEPRVATYIHSKLLIVDDCFFSVGSANLTNRSTSVDTELNLAVEVQGNDEELMRSIRAARRSLLAEHLGVPDLEQAEGLVAELDERVRERRGRLRAHPSPTPNEREILDVIDPMALPFDPGAPEGADRSVFLGGVGALWDRFISPPDPDYASSERKSLAM
jgi:phospholipase D1/2